MMHRKLALSALGLFAALVLFAALASPALAQGRGDRTVNVYNWSDYVAPGVIEDFTKETGIKVKYDTFDSNDTLETKLLAGKSGYDVVVPTAYFLERQIKAGVFQKLDKSKLSNLGNVWPEIAKRLATYDPGNQFAVNYMWGTTGIGYNVKKAREILGGTAPVEEQMASWDIIFKPEQPRSLQGLRRAHAGFARRHRVGRVALSRAQSELQGAGGPRQGGRSPDQDPAVRAQIPLLRISQRAGVG